MPVKSLAPYIEACRVIQRGSGKAYSREQGSGLMKFIPVKENLKLVRQYACLAIEEMARPLDFKSGAARARYLELHPKRFIRHHLGNYSKVYQLLDDWALMQFEHAIRRAG